VSMSEMEIYRQWRTGLANRFALSPGEILRITVLDRMYDGPQAWLVRRNVLIACVALIPTFLEVILWLLFLAGRLLAGTSLGDVAGPPIVIVALMLMPIAEYPYFAAFPFLLACIYLRLLLRSQEIPPRVKKRTALFVTGALLLMFVTVGLLYLQYRSGGFRL
jgi:hypothetical protein